jgi:hypothetical protein
MTAPRLKRSTYVYCVVVSARPPLVAGAPRGLAGARPARSLEIDRGVFAIVADVPSKPYSEAAINRHLANLDWVARMALAHESVVEHFIDAGAVLPMKLFTIFASDERAFAHLRAERSRLGAAARRVASHHEWGLRVMLDRERVRARSGTSPAGRERRARGRAPGWDYLKQKKARRDASLELTTRARRTVSSLYNRLAKHARLARRRAAVESAAQGGSLLLDAAFLVRRSRTPTFRALAAKEARALAPLGYAITLTGPWPPYSFVQE